MKELLKATAVTTLLSIVPLTQVSAVFFHNTDGSIEGSLCVGLDCVVNESFGFDTLRLKENNLRIEAQDTSTTGSFPSNDWRITFNDSSNGGANKFSIDDVSGSRTPFTIEAGAPTNSLYVDSSGRIGLGTSTPVAEVHVKDGDTPTTRLEQDGSSGFTPQTWDVAGNEANFFIRDVTNGSTLPFKIRPGAPSNALVIAPNGNVGIGAGTGPSEQLHLQNGNFLIEQTGTTDAILKLSSNTNEWEIKANQSTGRLTFFSPGGGATTASFKFDRQAKENLLRVGVAGTDVVDTSGKFVMIGTAGDWEIKNNPATGRLTFFSPGGGATTASFKFDRQAQENLLRVGVAAADIVDINGKLVINNVQINVPDYVFDPDYPLESIEEHAALMWDKRHLPALPSAQDSEHGIDVLGHQMGVLEELEKAHIYISQLNDDIRELKSQLALRAKHIDKLQAQIGLLIKKE